MKISLNWLNDYVQIDADGGRIAQILSDLGFPTEGIEYIDGDTVIDIEVTSNRGDCLSHIGVAREVSAALGRPLRLPQIELPESDRKAADFLQVRIDDPELCNRYTARIITGVKVGPSPDWLRKRLEAVGVRTVNNVVDASNYAMMESGQPPHAFDYDKLSVGAIVVRKALAGERIVTIDETKCDLKPDMLIIADDKGPVAIAGVMGGLESEVSDATTTILLEDAHFDPVSIRTTGRALGIASEASFRFERQVDVENIDWASQRCAQLICRAAGGQVAKGVVDRHPVKRKIEPVKMRLSRMNMLLGIEVSADDVARIFTGLGFAPQAEADDVVVCTPPTWRHDVYREADLIEEVARSYGYDKIPVAGKINIEVAPVDKREKVLGRLRTFLAGCGFHETINVTFVDESTARLFDGPDVGYLGVKDESRKGANLLRRTLIGSLAGVLKSNYNAGNIPCRVYEIADTFLPAQGRELTQKTKLALVCDADFRRLRGVIEGLIAVVSRDAKIEFKPAELTWARAGAEVFVDQLPVGVAGIVSQEIAAGLDLGQADICAAELDFQTLLDAAGAVATARPIPRFPAIVRDLSLVVDENITWADISQAVAAKAPAELEELQFVGIYRGKPIAQGKKSVTASLRFRDEDGTLRHETVDEFEKAILNELTKKLAAQLRTV
ncbi:MAG: phenylalanine--tRNA ligase subunit beta [Planctomycetota bacterium]|nr:MAG: phenylalanine--tRNA ligase subunit beta [Planctomycetota bacterium]